ncbi:TPA: DUF2269 family protein [Legionella pneumophila]|uniref:DUF2269 family protein n=1 Tax=Legionella sp. PATHC039 TaxID=2992042 RepID=UPI0007785EA2|nr:MULTISPECIES: DUF2269 domain-containing protein [Legionella]HAT8857885.1 DUF2269 family protein [Legionella pneumophila subsp. pneumophila]MCW8395222.1 DUF2269 domain-containing protein [Legionella sp. PATHC039]HAT7072422.1 DUF2269 family protein [Legionella pneumophila]HAT8641132.1 DUF2269 family protein [Legionella pneumophila]HAT8868885.1 DUF2269 family protein [Legionella pneumophila subsp. pneumophila]
MLYFYLKFIHVLSSAILFGTGIGTASVMVYGHRTKNPIIIAAISKYVVFADWIFTGTSGILQPLTGFAMIYLAGFSWTSLWILGSILGYVVAACCWFPVVCLQIKMRDLAIETVKNNTTLPEKYHRYFLYWFILGWPAFLSLVGVFYLMTNKPDF